MIENLPKGAIRDPEDKRDYKIETLGALPLVDWNKPFSVPEPRNEDQGQSDACVSYSCSYYHENNTPNKIFSRRDLFARIAQSYGAAIRDGILAIVKQGQATRDEVSDPVNPTPQNMRDKTGIDPEQEADDRQLDGFVIPSNDIDTCAAAIKAYGGVVFGVDGTNTGWQDLLNPRPPQSGDSAIWGHALYAKGYHLHNGAKCIIAKSSWCNTGVTEHHIKENYFKSNHTFNPWTLIPRKEKTMLKKYKITVPNEDGSLKEGVLIIEGFTGAAIFAKDPQAKADFLKDLEVPADAPIINLPA